MAKRGGTDTFVVNGRAGTAETFRIYRGRTQSRAASVVGAASRSSSPARSGVTTVIAELDNIEEITVNTLNTTANNGNNPNYARRR